MIIIFQVICFLGVFFQITIYTAGIQNIVMCFFQYRAAKKKGYFKNVCHYRVQIYTLKSHL